MGVSERRNLLIPEDHGEIVGWHLDNLIEAQTIIVSTFRDVIELLSSAFPPLGEAEITIYFNRPTSRL